MEHGNPLVAGHIGANPGIQAHGADVEGVVIVDPDKVKLLLPGIQQLV